MPLYFEHLELFLLGSISTFLEVTFSRSISGTLEGTAWFDSSTTCSVIVGVLKEEHFLSISGIDTLCSFYFDASSSAIRELISGSYVLACEFILGSYYSWLIYSVETGGAAGWGICSLIIGATGADG